jgi:hypothetical protein
MAGVRFRVRRRHDCANLGDVENNLAVIVNGADAMRLLCELGAGEALGRCFENTEL